VLDYAVRKNGLSFELWDVLTQLSFTTLVAFLIMDWSVRAQLLVSALCLILPELLYRYSHIPGYDQPFVDQHNFGNYVDLLLMNKINPAGWVAIKVRVAQYNAAFLIMSGLINGAFCALDAILFRQLPVRDPARLVQIQLLEDGAPVRVSYPLFRELDVGPETPGRRREIV